jgi:hypothetical protein
MACLAAVCWSLVALSSPTTAALENSVKDFTVKAAYLSKFGGFIRWPDTAFSSDSSPITVCVIGESPVAGALDKVLSGRQTGSRAVIARSIKAVTSDSGCHVLYVGDSNRERVTEILDAVRGMGVLTVTDLPNVSAVINFVIKENNVRFEIDEQAAFDHGLVISSQLLGLAVSVKTRG